MTPPGRTRAWPRSPASPETRVRAPGGAVGEGLPWGRTPPAAHGSARPRTSIPALTWRPGSRLLGRTLSADPGSPECAPRPGGGGGGGCGAMTQQLRGRSPPPPRPAARPPPRGSAPGRRGSGRRPPGWGRGPRGRGAAAGRTGPRPLHSRKSPAGPPPCPPHESRGRAPRLVIWESNSFLLPPPPPRRAGRAATVGGRGGRPGRAAPGSPEARP